MTKTKILIALDGSAWSRQILTPIRRLLTPADHELVLLRVAELPTGIVGAPPRPVSASWMTSMYESQRDIEYALHPIYDSQLEANERAAIELTLLPDQQLLRRDGYSVTSMVRFGDPAEEIGNLARSADIDIVAMATHGQAGLRRLLMGSVAEQVLRDLTIPVLLMRPSDRTEDPALTRPALHRLTALVPLDGSPTAEQALDCAIDLASNIDARLVLAAVEPVSGDINLAEAGAIPSWELAEHESAIVRLNGYLKQTATQLRQLDLDVETRLAEGSTADEILRISAAEHADIIIMTTRGRSGVERLLLGSVAAKVLQNANVPVLLARACSQRHAAQARKRHAVRQR
jgi:nucleotide-binding universal stress UspA family protein